MSDAREAILARIREANANAAANPMQQPRPDADLAPRLPQLTDATPASADVLELFIERTADYRAVVECVRSTEVAAAVGVALTNADGVIVPTGFPAEWAAHVDASNVRPDPGSAAELDRIEGVLTTCAAAIAETGTIVLDHHDGQGRRALTLVPDLHVVVVKASQVFKDVPHGMAALRHSIVEGRVLTWISGPSATSDIELERVEGVHGPRRLHVVVVEDA